MDKISKNAPCVVIANHQSTLDLLSLTSHMPKDIIYVGKKDLLYIPIFGQIFWLAGHLSINRKSLSEAKKSLTKAKSLFSKKKCLIIMPEGTRSWSGEMGPFKKGAFHIAHDCQVNILPLVISSYDHLDFNKLKAGRVVVEVLEPIKYPESLQKEYLDDFIKNTREVLVNNLRANS